MAEFTERQLKALPEFVQRAKDAGAHTIETPDVTHASTFWSWTFVWREESRPGRGQDLDAFFNDGEFFVQITLDVYGNGSVSVAELNWIHGDSDEECDCPLCASEREE